MFYIACIVFIEYYENLQVMANRIKEKKNRSVSWLINKTYRINFIYKSALQNYSLFSD